jgi:hypothetical protein
MDNFQIKQNLLKFNNAFVMNIKGKSSSKMCVCIPIEDNHLFVSTDDNLKAKAVYADVNVNQYEEGKSQYGDTHYLRLSVPKEIREKMTEEEKKAIPYLGNMKPSQIQQKQSADIESPTYSVPEDDKDDLPF